jgi:hypothetical protein
MEVLNVSWMKRFFDICWKRFPAASLWAVLSAISLVSPCLAQEGPVATEYEIKAAFLLNFAKFTEWPPSKFSNADAPLIFGILGDDPFDGQLDKMLKDKTIGGRHVRLERYKSPAEAKNAHVVFVGGADKRKAGSLAAALKGSSVLTVSDADQFAESGGMIGFKTVSNRIRFEINTKAAEKENIKISSKLLSLATNILK